MPCVTFKGVCVCVKIQHEFAVIMVFVSVVAELDVVKVTMSFFFYNRW